MIVILIIFWSPNIPNVAINYKNELIIQGRARQYLLERARSLLRETET